MWIDDDVRGVSDVSFSVNGEEIGRLSDMGGSKMIQADDPRLKTAEGWVALDDYTDPTEGVGKGELPLVNLFGLLGDGVPYLPEQVKDFFQHENNRVAHTIAQFFINSLLRYDGILLRERTVAARLGVDMDKSADWAVLVNSIEDFSKYNGIFSEYHLRWWSYAIEDWWESTVSSDHLASLTSKERVEALKEYFGEIALVESTPTVGHTGSKFWYTCLFDQVPLDPTDAFKLVFTEKRDWQDNIYCSYNAIMSRKHKTEGFTLAGQDLERFRALRGWECD